MVGFTKFSSNITPLELMKFLNHMYTVFDEITERYGLYKVEIIGDAYFIVGGCPEKTSDHVAKVMAAACEMRASLPLLREAAGDDTIDIRIGVHVGPVAAGECAIVAVF